MHLYHTVWQWIDSLFCKINNFIYTIKTSVWIFATLSLFSFYYWTTKSWKYSLSISYAWSTLLSVFLCHQLFIDIGIVFTKYVFSFCETKRRTYLSDETFNCFAVFTQNPHSQLSKIPQKVHLTTNSCFQVQSYNSCISHVNMSTEVSWLNG